MDLSASMRKTNATMLNRTWPDSFLSGIPPTYKLLCTSREEICKTDFYSVKWFDKNRNDFLRVHQTCYLRQKLHEIDKWYPNRYYVCKHLTSDSEALGVNGLRTYYQYYHRICVRQCYVHLLRNFSSEQPKKLYQNGDHLQSNPQCQKQKENERGRKRVISLRTPPLSLWSNGLGKRFVAKKVVFFGLFSIRDIIHSISTSYFLLPSLFPEHQGWKRPKTLNTRKQNMNYLTQRRFMRLFLSFYLFLFCLLSVIVLSQNVSPPLLSFFWKSSHIWDSFHHSKYY